MKAYNNVAPENGVVRHLLQAGQQPWHDSAVDWSQDLQKSRYPTSPARIRCRTKCCSVHIFFHRRLIVLHCLWCRGANPCQYTVYLINNVNDPVCGCNVVGHKMSALKGQVLEKREERGFVLILWDWWFPRSSHCGFPHLPKSLSMAAPRHHPHRFTPGAGLPSGNHAQERGLQDTLLFPVCRLAKPWACLHWSGYLG